MKAIVTGANGFIGSNLIEKLHKEGIEVYGVVRSHKEDVSSIQGLCHIIYSEIADLETDGQFINLGGSPIFYHLAWQGVNGPDKAEPIVQNNNIKMALQAAKAAKRIGCKKFLCAGTIAEEVIHSLPSLDKVSGGTMYGVAKSACRLLVEAYCKNTDLPYVWMQFSNIYGPKNKTGNLISYTLSQLKKGEPATFGPAAQPYDFVFADDLIEAVYRLGVKEQTNGFYYIGSGEPKILSEFLYMVGEEYGRKDLIKIGERPDDGIKYDFSMFSIDRIKKDIGDYVSKPFAEHIRETIDNGK